MARTEAIGVQSPEEASCTHRRSIGAREQPKELLGYATKGSAHRISVDRLPELGDGTQTMRLEGRTNQ